MLTDQVDASAVTTPSPAELRQWSARVLAGGAITRAEASRLFRIETTADLFELFAWANRIREQFHGKAVHLCSIVNVKAGGCPEDCRFCAQSAHYETASPRYDLADTAAVLKAADEAHANQVGALGIVAAWRGLTEGRVLDEICACLKEMRGHGKARVDASLGLISSDRVAARLKAAGLVCYNHNLETSRRFFPEICGTHSYEDRLRTITHLKRAGIQVCSGGIFGMGETCEDRCDLAFALKELEVDFVPVNFLNPIPGTPLAKFPGIPPLEALKCLAVLRFVLPRQVLFIAGGRVVNLRHAQSLMFAAGASGLMVGNYLTTVNRPIADDLEMLHDLGLHPRGHEQKLQLATLETGP